jgi:hypothetical protein
LYHAASVSFLVAAGFAILGVLSSSVRTMKPSPDPLSNTSNKEYE